MFALLAALPPQGADPRAGSWALVSAQASLTPADKLSVVETQGTVHVAMSGETHLDFTARADGKDTAVPGNAGFNQVELSRMGKKQVEVIEKKDGVVMATIREALSPDKNELTITTSSAGHASQVTVWSRNAGTKAVADPFEGEWTEDPGKTRLRQGLVLKIEPDGSGGVRFSGDYSYTARFDGKPYDVKNSRNDTVVLGLVDPRTVDAAYQRDGQQTQKDRWVVSGDGQQMTLTSTSTLENGQRLSETLGFKKQ